MDHAQHQVADQDVRLRPHTKPPVLRHGKRQRAFRIQMPAAAQARTPKLPCFFKKKITGTHITDSICTTVHDIPIEAGLYFAPPTHTQTQTYA